MKKKQLYVTNAKLRKTFELSNKEAELLYNLKANHNVDGIKSFFLNETKYELHSASFNIISYDGAIIMFCNHASLDMNMIVIVHNNMVYEYGPKFGQRLFFGPASKTVYSTGKIIGKTKPVDIVIAA